MRAISGAERLNRTASFCESFNVSSMNLMSFISSTFVGVDCPRRILAREESLSNGVSLNFSIVSHIRLNVTSLASLTLNQLSKETLYSQHRTSNPNGSSSSVRSDNVMLFSFTLETTPSTAFLAASVRSFFFDEPDNCGCNRQISPVRIACVGITPPVDTSLSKSINLLKSVYIWQGIYVFPPRPVRSDAIVRLRTARPRT